MKSPAQPVSRERDPEARKERILAAAGVVFGKAGFAAGSVREISRRARVNLASINYYFGSKEGLYRELLLAAHQQVLTLEAPPTLAEGADARETLRQWVDFCLRFVLVKRPSHPVLGRLMAHEMRQPSPVLNELVKRVIDPIFGELKRVVAAVGRGKLSSGQVEMFAHHLIGMCVHYEQGAQVIKRLGFAVPDSETGIAKLADSITTLALGGISGAASNRPSKTSKHS
ncbi:MAG: CerR family C-terminal domain-containing protein [Verrucomicrobiales bacterium]|nr:CerR family C-terminal domain-containing protein [Verrucomicrobiales bacterium]